MKKQKIKNEKTSKKSIKINLKVAIIITLFILLLLFISLYSFIIYINKKDVLEVSTLVIDYESLNNLQLSDQLSFSVLDIDYNLENFPLDYYVKKYKNNFLTHLTSFSEENLNNNNLEITHYDFWLEPENENSSIDSYYFIKETNFIILINTFYQNKELYNKYEESITYLASNIEIPKDKTVEYENIFTNMLTSIDFPNEDDIKKYKAIANQDSPYIRTYDSLTDSQKEKYDILYKTILVNKEQYITEAFYYEDIDNPNIPVSNTEDDYNAAIEALKADLIYLGYEHYYIIYEYIDEEMKNSYKCLIYAQFENDIHLAELDLKYGQYYPETIQLTNEERNIFDKKVNTIINNMPNNLSTLGKYKYLADSICEITEYDYEEYEKMKNQDTTNFRIFSMIGVFVDGKAVCAGYAEAYFYLCTKVGLFCNIFEAGDFKNPLNFGHAFNYIKLGNKYYFVDVTWLDENDNKSFAFIYDKNIENEHNTYIEHWFDVELPKDSPIKDLMDNLGKIDWYDVKSIL